MTTIDEITRVASVSRASFYTYFPSKRDVLLALGKDSLVVGASLIDRLGRVTADGFEDGLLGFGGQRRQGCDQAGHGGANCVGFCVAIA